MGHEWIFEAHFMGVMNVVAQIVEFICNKKEYFFKNNRN